MIDSTADLQSRIDTAAENEVTIPLGDWYVDATKGLLLRSGSRLTINGNLRATPTDQDWSHILLAEGVYDVSIIINGQVIGERRSHRAPGNGHGMGVMISNSNNVRVSGKGIVTQCWGDGVYVINSKKISVDIVSSDNRRNGMSVISVDGLTVRGAYNYNGGTDPCAGIDLEPDYASEFIKNVDISGCQFVGNLGTGVLFGFGGAPRANFQNVRVHDNLFKDNKPISGLNTPVSNFLYLFRWVPGYNWWGFPTTVTL